MRFLFFSGSVYMTKTKRLPFEQSPIRHNNKRNKKFKINIQMSFGIVVLLHRLIRF